MSLKDIRKYREPFFDTSIVDTGGTFLIGILLAKRYNTNKSVTIGGLFVLGYVTHSVFKIETKLNKV
jgi:hypothetical protein